ncbi:MAG: pyridoxamine 5'-phosphate oxidase [Planctomycetota bacterium]
MAGILDLFRRSTPDRPAPTTESASHPPGSIESMRKAYRTGELVEDQAPAGDPWPLFREWFGEAVETARQHRWAEPNAVTLATADADGTPAARVVLLKGLDAGLIFYTNYASAKGRALASNPVACLNFFWPWLERQVRFTGPVEKLGREASEAYFRSRPHGSQLGALLSEQSREVEDRASLDVRLEELEVAYPKDDPDRPVPMPDHWGGYRLTPVEVEFWQGRDNRVHDRLVYRRDSIETPTFMRTRLQP